MKKRSVIHFSKTRPIAWGLVLVLSTAFAWPVMASCCCLPPGSSDEGRMAEVSSAGGCCSEESSAVPQQMSGNCCAEMGEDSTTIPAPVTSHVHQNVELKRVELTFSNVVDIFGAVESEVLRALPYRVASPPGPAIYLLVTSLVI